jgi:hypothetical protein
MCDDKVPPQVLDVLAVALEMRYVVDLGRLPIACSHVSACHAEHGGDDAANFANDENFRRHLVVILLRI